MTNLANDAWPYVIYSWLLFALSTPFVATRLYVQFRFRNRPYREIFVVIAWTLYLIYTGIDSKLVDLNWYNGSLTAEQLYTKQNLVLNWVTGLIYKQILYACKAALLCFYGEISKRQFFPKTWWAIVVCWVLVGLGSLVVFLQCLLPCLPHPVTHLWDPALMMQDCLFVVLDYWVKVGWSFHIGTDIIVYILPFVIMHNIKHITPADKRGAYFMFGFGLLNIGTAIVIFSCYLRLIIPGIPLKVVYDYNIAQLFLFSFQPSSALIIICLPYCRRLWHGVRAKDLRPELNTGNMTVHHNAAAQTLGHLESGTGASGSTHSQEDHHSSKEKLAMEVMEV